MINKFIEASLQRLRERMSTYSSTILSTPLNLEDYRVNAGKIKGLQEAEEILKDVYDVIVNGKQK